MEFPPTEDHVITQDVITDLPLPHLSFILRHFLPMSYSIANRRPLEDAMKKLWQGDDSDPWAQVLPSGSLFEGMNLPATIHGYTTKPVGQRRIDSSDQDQMILVKGKYVTDEGDDSQGGVPDQERLEIFTDKIHAGYLQLRVKDASKMRNPHMYTQKKNDSYFYYTPAEVKEMVAAELEPVKERYKERLFTEQGPALTVQTPETLLSQEVFFDHDFVFPVFSCPKWPRVAENWITRRRPSGWPDADLVNVIVSQGCHVVPVSHPHSAEPEIEWRMSFSLAELVLMRDVTPIQRQCYLLLKALHSQALKVPQHLKAPGALEAPKGLISYHLKNVFLWVCETVPRSQWTPDSIATRLFDLLNHLHKCLQSKNIPSYFIPENNLIDRFEENVCQYLKDQVEDVRKDPLKHLFEFNRNRKWFFGPIYLDAKKIFEPIVEDAKKSSDLKRTFTAFQYVAFYLAGIHLHEHMALVEKKRIRSSSEADYDPRYTYPYDNAIDAIEDSVRMCQQTFHKVDHDAPLLLDQLGGTLLRYVDGSISLYEVLLNRYKDAANKHVFQARLARLHHVKYHRVTGNNEKRRELARKADDNFKRSVEGQPDVRADYAWFLWGRGERGSSCVQARAVIAEGVENIGSTNVYHSHDKAWMDDTISAEIARREIARREIARQGVFKVTSRAMCYYLLIKIQAESDEDATTTLKDFEGFLRALQTSPGVHVEEDAVHNTELLVHYGRQILQEQVWYRKWFRCQLL